MKTITAQAKIGTTILGSACKVPDEIQFMPPGVQTITPIIDGEPRTVTIEVTEELAERFAADLQELREAAARGAGDFPFIDFNHKDDAAAGEVLSMRWAGEDPKTGGIRARIKWSYSGRTAVEGKNYRRFSPQWAMDAESLEPVRLTANCGGLVNRAAFQSIQSVVMARLEPFKPGSQKTVIVSRVQQRDPGLDFVARAKQYGGRMGITDESKAMASFAQTPEGTFLYTEFMAGMRKRSR